MSFLTRELSRALGVPYTAYHIKYGDDAAAYYAYTDAAQEISAPGSLAGETVTYEPAVISHEDITTSGTLDKQQLVVEVPRTSPLVDLFIIYPPSQVVQLTIRQGHVGSTDSVPVKWSGRIVAMTLEGSTAKFSCEPILTSMRRNGLRRNYMIGCPYALYSDSCRANKTAATTNVIVQSISGNTIGLSASWFPHPIIKYVGGMVQWTGPRGTEIRTILQVSDPNLIVGGRLSNLSVGDVISVILGCNHLMDDCRDLHVEVGTNTSNINNFGGQPWIPLKNPINKSQAY